MIRKKNKTTTHQTGTPPLTRDDCARITAEAINAALEKLSIPQIVDGIGVFPAGEDVLLVDIIMHNLMTKNTWGISVTIPPSQEVTDGRE